MHVYSFYVVLLFSRGMHWGHHSVGSTERVNTRPYSLITRHDIRVKHKRPLVAHSAVTFTHIHFTVTLLVTISIDTIVIVPQRRALDVSGILYIIFLKCWLYTRVSPALEH